MLDRNNKFWELKLSFKSIEFGRTSGEAEAAEVPYLVEQGYVDDGLLEPLLSQKKWLLLARKGAGKSLLGEKIKQVATTEKPASAVSLIHLADFPYKTFSQLMPSAVEAESRYPASWSWLLCLQIIDALSVHPGSTRSLNIDVNGAIAQLKTFGLLPTSDIQQLVVRSSKAGFRAQIPSILELFGETNSTGLPQDLAFLNLVGSLKKLISSYNFHGRQFLVIDGLDDILTKATIQYETLSALIFEVGRLNAHFRNLKLNVWIIVLCRTDIYEILPGANKNKLRQDSSLEIDWYPPAGTLDESKLISLVNLRAKLSLKRDVEVSAEFFPATMEHGVKTEKYLIDLTRHTPRDFIALMTHIQKASKRDTLSKTEILGGAKLYSERYFLPEIRDELVGYVTAREFEIFLNSVGEIHERRFTLQRLETVATQLGLQRKKLDVLMHALFSASAIGQTWRDPGARQDWFEFKFRNPNASFNPRRAIVLHKGLWKALNLS